MSSQSENDAGPSKSKLSSLVWVLVPTLLILAALALMFELTP